MTPNEILQLSEPVELMYMDASSQLLINLCRHFKTDKALPTREWEIKKLGELGQLTEESIEIIAYNTGQSKKAIKQAVSEALVKELSPLEKKLNDAAKKGLIQGNNIVLGAPEATQNVLASESVITVLENLVGQAADDTNIVNTVMLESVRNQYVNAINNTLMFEAQEIEKLQSAGDLISLEEQLKKTQRTLNASTFSVASGAEARTTALRRAIGQLAQQGITGYVDKGGHRWTPEAYINMDIRTTVHNAAIQGQRARAADFGVETFQVSSHSGARPLCAPYQGKFYSWGGDSGTIYDIDGNAYKYESINVTSYGEPAGLFGINCGHFPQTFISGFSTPRYGPTEDEAENNRIYKESQQQRAIEREIRSAKTEALAYEAAGDQEGFEKAAQKVKQKTADYKTFCEDTGRTPRNDRTQVVGYSRSTAAKATAAAKRAELARATDFVDQNEVGTNILGAIYDQHREKNNLRLVPFADANRLSKIVYADYGKIPDSVADVYNSTIQRYASTYDTPLTQVRTMTKEEYAIKYKAFAFVNHSYETDSARMVINPVKNQSTAAITKDIKEMEARGFCVKVKDGKEAEYIATHEFGHTLINMTQPLPRKNYIGFDKTTILQAREEINGIWGDYYNAVSAVQSKLEAANKKLLYGATVEEMKNAATEAKSLTEQLNKLMLSTDSMKDSDEFVAESFVNVKIGVTPNSYAVDVVKVLDKYFKR